MATKSNKKQDAVEVLDSESASLSPVIDAAVKARLPVMLVGAPGTGKTAAVKHFARQIGYELIILVGSRMDPTDISGLPSSGIFVDSDGVETNVTVQNAQEWQARILSNPKTILFLDEYSNSPSAVQASMLSLIQDRQFPNGRNFPQETIIIGAMNPPEEAADGYDMSLPTVNRFMWVAWDPKNLDWTANMRTAWGQEVSEEELFWKRRIATFIEKNPSFLHMQPELGAVPSSHGLDLSNPSKVAVATNAWPSRRSWDNLSKALAFVDKKDTYTQDALAQGLIGSSASSSFREFLRKLEVIDPLDVIAEPYEVDWQALDISDVNLLLRGVLEYADKSNIKNVVDVFVSLAKADRAALGTTYIEKFIKVGVQLGKDDLSVKKKISEELLPLYKKISKEAVQAV